MIGQNPSGGGGRTEIRMASAPLPHAGYGPVNMVSLKSLIVLWRHRLNTRTYSIITYSKYFIKNRIATLSKQKIALLKKF